MSENNQNGQRINGVEHILSRLKEHSQIISEVYYQGAISKDEDNARRISILQQHRVLIPRDGQTYVIHPKFREFLNIALNKERLYSIQMNYGALFERLEKLMEELQYAFSDGRISAYETYEEEVRESINDISSILSSDLSQLRILVENHFGVANTISEKRRQNNYYIQRTEKAIKLISEVGNSEWMKYGGTIQTNAAFVGVVAIFREQLQDKFAVFRQHLNDILDILHQYMFEYRIIEKRTIRLRKTWDYLEHHPDHVFQDYSEGPNPPLWLWKYNGIIVQGYPNVRADYEDTLAEIAERITTKKMGVSVSKKRPRGTLIETEPLPDMKVEKEPYQHDIYQMVALCIESNQRLSARQWYQDHHDDMCYTGKLSIWLQSVSESLNRQNILYPKVSIQYIESSITGWTGNILIEDVEIFPCTPN